MHKQASGKVEGHSDHDARKDTDSSLKCGEVLDLLEAMILGGQLHITIFVAMANLQETRKEFERVQDRKGQGDVGADAGKCRVFPERVGDKSRLA